ncbi:MAG TPA: type I 3-dehydroquinate dehydratase [Streptosporangiaceae bacterium]|nr:type I 3-dehydroquinate dehydratase [Streptosporangiaceae bacterium]
MVVVLVGFMGAGKTTVGHIVAERLGLPFVDSDVLIEQRQGREIRDIFRTEGEPYFRQFEHETVAGLVRGQDAVIALGGGAVEDPRSRAVLRGARVVYLRVGYDEAMARVDSDEFRPMLRRPDLGEVYKRRLPVYEDLSVLTIDTDGRPPGAIALEVLAQLTRLPETPPANRVAASLAPEDTGTCLRELDRLAPRIGLAEVRLDLMGSFDVAKLVANSPVPLVLTCRPEREGGGFTGPDSERAGILRTAWEAGCAYLDVEADSLDLVSGWGGGSPTRVIASQHWFEAMPSGLLGRYRELRDRCAVVKLVGTARSAADVLPVLELLRDASTPVIGLAMGGPGTCTRILAPAFPHALLTYGAATAAAVTAPGQITAEEMTDRYALHLVTPKTAVYLHVTRPDDARHAQQQAEPGTELHVPLRAEDPTALAARLRKALPFTIA